MPVTTTPRRVRIPKRCQRCAAPIRYGRTGNYVPMWPAICFACFIKDHSLHACPVDDLGCKDCE